MVHITFHLASVRLGREHLLDREVHGRSLQQPGLLPAGRQAQDHQPYQVLITSHYDIYNSFRKINLYFVQGVIISPPCYRTPPSMRLPPPRMTRRSWRPSLIWTRCWIFLCLPLMKASTSRPPLMLRATSLTRWELDIDIWAHFFFTFLTIETKSFDYVLWKLP